MGCKPNPSPSQTFNANSALQFIDDVYHIYPNPNHMSDAVVKSIEAVRCSPTLNHVTVLRRVGRLITNILYYP